MDDHARRLEDRAHADELVRLSWLDWTLVHPVHLTDGARTQAWVAEEAPHVRASDRVSRADVADFVVNQLASTQWSRRVAVLRSGG